MQRSLAKASHGIAFRRLVLLLRAVANEIFCSVTKKRQCCAFEDSETGPHEAKH